jgi:hypothetical protein
MLGAIMAEPRNPLADLAPWPGGRPTIAAAGLVGIAALLTLFADRPSTEAAAAGQVAEMSRRLDSLSVAVVTLRDSLVAVVAQPSVDAGKSTTLSAAGRIPVRPVARSAGPSKATPIRLAPPPNLSAVLPPAPPPRIDSLR